MEGQVEISAARWAGVALVVAALLGAIILAVVSPAGGSSGAAMPALVTAPSVAPAASPGASPAGGRVPTQQPEIIDPLDDAELSEWETQVTVELLEDALPREDLTLEIHIGDKVVKRVQQPEPGKLRPTIRLTGQRNVLTAVLRGPGGLGPVSEPVTVMLDREAPTLTLTSPGDDLETPQKTVELIGSTEPGALLEAHNVKTKQDLTETIGPDGAFRIVVPLEMGRNRIRLKATDEAGGRSDLAVLVKRIDSKPQIKIVAPKGIKRKSLPKDVTFRVVVKDATGAFVEGAKVTFALSVFPQPTETMGTATDENGRAAWPTTLGPASSESATLSVEVTMPTGETRSGTREIKLR